MSDYFDTKKVKAWENFNQARDKAWQDLTRRLQREDPFTSNWENKREKEWEIEKRNLYGFTEEIAQEDIKKTNKEFEEYLNRLSGNESIPDFLKTYMGGVERTIPRNQFGIVMDSKKCSLCVDHQEHIETCDLCDKRWAYEKLHKPKYGKDWIVEEVHECAQVKIYLQNILYAVIF